MKARHWALIVLLLLGIVKIPVERAASRTLRDHQVLQPPPNLSLRDNLGQLSFAAALGGLRSLVASITYLQGFTAHEHNDWASVDRLMTITTLLQPRYAAYWDSAAAFMSYDAAHYYRYNRERPFILRDQLYQQHIERGQAILQEGLRHLPNSARLHEQLGYVFARRMQTGDRPQPGDTWLPPDHKRAGEEFLKARQCGALPAIERQAAYQFALLDNDPEAWRTGYEILMRTYRTGFRPEGMLLAIKTFEEKLGIPAAQRIPEGPRLPAR